MKNGIEMKNLNPNEFSQMTDLELYQKVDRRGYTLLMVAAEAGLIDVVKNLLLRGEDVNHKVKGETAASLAFSRGHYEMVLILIQANSEFPYNYNNDHICNELRNLTNLCTIAHDHVRSGEVAKIREILALNQYLRYVFDIRNNSLLKTAILSKDFTIYEILVNSNLLLAPQESVEEFLNNLTPQELNIINDINEKFSPNIFTDEMMTLMRNCRFNQELPPDKNNECLFTLRKGFELLFSNPSTAVVLKSVAATKNFTIIFDFERDSMTFLDFDEEPYMHKNPYKTRKIYIAAKDVLKSNRTTLFFSGMAHELSHYAMSLTFKNFGKPYLKNDKNSRNTFDSISQECYVNKNYEPFLSSVFEEYPYDMHHSELIVRVPQMIVQYDKTQRLEVARERFSPLFEFYEEECVPIMNEKVEKIKSGNDGKFNGILGMNIFVGLILCLGLLLLGITLMLFFTEPKENIWINLSEEKQNAIENTYFNFYNNSLKLIEVFPKNSSFYHTLGSEEINELLDKNSTFMEEKIKAEECSSYFTWAAMTKNLKEILKGQSIYFQKKIIQVKLLSNETLKLLDSSHILSIFNENQRNYSKPFGAYFNVKDDANFNTSWVFLSEEVEIKRRFYHGNDKVRTDKKEIKLINDLITELKDNKILLFTSSEGFLNAKVFHNFGRELKKSEPFTSTWMQHISLDKLSDDFNEIICDNFIINSANANNNLKSTKARIADYLNKKLMKLEGNDFKVFESFLISDKVTFLWDAENAKKSSKKLIKCTQNLTESFHVILSRKDYLNEFKEDRNVKIYKQLPDTFVYKWDYLEYDDRKIIYETNLDFCHFSIKLKNVFNETFYTFLNPVEIKTLLAESSNFLSFKIQSEYSNYFSWITMTKPLKDKLKKNKIKFQGEEVELKMFDEEILKLLNSEDVFKICYNSPSEPFGNSFNINEDENIKSSWIFIDENKNITSDFYDDNDMVKTDISDSLLIDNLGEILKSNKTILLDTSDGVTNSSIFDNFAKKLKQTKPLKATWMLKIDLKKIPHSFVGENFNAFEIIPDYLNKNFMNLMNRDFEVFKTFLKSGNVTFLWDAENMNKGSENFIKWVHNLPFNFHVILSSKNNFKNVPSYKQLPDTRPYKWEYLSDQQRNRIKDSSFDFCELKLKLSDVFDDTFYEPLDSTQIHSLLSNLEFIPHKIKLPTHSKYFTWTTMKESLKKKLKEKKSINFQGENVILGRFREAILRLLKSVHIFGICDGSNPAPFGSYFNINEDMKIESSWNFVGANVKVTSDFYDNYEKLKTNGKNVILIENLGDTLKEKTIILLESSEGTTNSTSFQNFGKQLKHLELFKPKWVQFVDLNDFSATISGEICNTNTSITEYFSLINSEQKDTFQTFFESGDVVFLWDGEVMSNISNDLIECILKSGKHYHIFLTKKENFGTFQSIQERPNLAIYKQLPDNFPYKWDNLNNEDKKSIKEKTIEFCDFDVQIQYIFDNDDYFYQSLNTDQIRSLIRNDSDFMQSIIKLPQHSKYFTWKEKMTKSLKILIKEKEIDFQSEKVKLKLFNNKILNLLNSKDIFEICEKNIAEPFGNSFNIKDDENIDSKWIFVDENVKVTGDFYNENDEVKNIENGVLLIKDLRDILKDKKIVLLETFDGVTNSTSFHNFGKQLKQLEPFKSTWMQHIDLKAFDENFSCQNLNIEQKITKFNEIFMKLNQQDFDIFKTFLHSGNVIFLWDAENTLKNSKNPLNCIPKLPTNYHVILSQNFTPVNNEKVKIYKQLPDTRPYKWEYLSGDKQSIIKNSSKKFCKLSLTLNDIFDNDQMFFNSLNSSELDALLNNTIPLDSKFFLGKYDSKFMWNNMNLNLRDIFREKEVFFQGIEVQIKNFSETIVTDLNLNFLDICDGINPFNVSFNIQNEDDDKNIKWVFVKKSIGINESFYEENYLTLKSENNDFISISKLEEQLLSKNMLLFTSSEGALSSSFFKAFGLEFKKHLPNKWLQYIEIQNEDLTHISDCSFQNINTILNLKPDEFRIFVQFLNAGEVVFLWNFESLSQLTNNIENCIKQSTKNFHVILLKTETLNGLNNQNLEIFKLLPEKFPYAWINLNDSSRDLIRNKSFYCDHDEIKLGTIFGQNKKINALKPITIKKFLTKRNEITVDKSFFENEFADLFIWRTMSPDLKKYFGNRKVSFQGKPVKIERFSDSILNNLNDSYMDFCGWGLSILPWFGFNFDTEESETKWKFFDDKDSPLNFSDVNNELEKHKILFLSSDTSCERNDFVIFGNGVKKSKSNLTLMMYLDVKNITLIKKEILDVDACLEKKDSDVYAFTEIRKNLTIYLLDFLGIESEKESKIFEAFFSAKRHVVFLWDAQLSFSDHAMKLFVCIDKNRNVTQILLSQNEKLKNFTELYQTYKNKRIFKIINDENMKNTQPDS